MVSGVALPARLAEDEAWLRISPSATTEPSAVPLVVAMTRLVSGGTVMRTACGSTTYARVQRRPKPVERAASH